MNRTPSEGRQPPACRNRKADSKRPSSCLKERTIRDDRNLALNTTFTPGLQKSYHDTFKSLNWPLNSNLVPVCCGGNVVRGPLAVKVQTVVIEPQRIHFKNVPVYPELAVQGEVLKMRRNAEQDLTQILSKNFDKYLAHEKQVYFELLD